MANNTRDILESQFRDATGSGNAPQQSASQVIDQLTSAVAGATSRMQTLTDAAMVRGGDASEGVASMMGQAAGTTGAVLSAVQQMVGGSSQAASTPSAGGSGVGGTLESIAATVLRSSFGVVPLISGLLGLFGGGSTEPPALEKYQMPASIAFQGADTGSGIAEADYDQFGMARAYGTPAAAPAPPSSSTTAGSAAATAPASQINVTVQAMDAQSFMDRSQDIARAVRDAMLNLSSINDVVNEL
ncbi:MAG TPA: hypothetical protein VG675_18000 [Bryobacteraceae bacterium]|nr:hypothetical protein [Bryobacteraceae bacterium]